MIAGLIESGVQILVGILDDPRVKSAIAKALASARESEAGLAVPKDNPGEAGEGDNAAKHGKWVVVAGLPADEQRSVKST